MSQPLYDQDHERLQRIVDLQTKIRAVADHITSEAEWLLFEIDMAGHWGTER